MVNNLTLIGRTGKDPEVRRLDSGTAVAKFSLATTETRKDKSGEKQEETQWHNITLWGSLAELAEKYIKKGMLLYLEGKVKYTEYTDKEGAKRYATEIVGNTFKFLEKAPQNAPNQANGQGAGDAPELVTGSTGDVGEDLPF